MNTTTLPRIAAIDSEYRRRSKDLLLQVLLLGFVASFLTAAGILLRTRGIIENPITLLLLTVVPWSAAAIAIASWARHVAFFADQDSFRPDIVPLSMIGRARRGIAYQDVAEAEHSPRVEGYWWIRFRLRSGSVLWLRKAPEIPDDALEFLLGQLSSRDIPTTPRP